MIELPGPLNIDATEREAAAYAQSLARACRQIIQPEYGVSLAFAIGISGFWLDWMDRDRVVDAESAERAKPLWQSVEDWKVAEKARNPRYALRELMSAMSEEAECASWQPGTEHRLWDAMSAGEPTEWGRLKLDAARLGELRRLHEAAGGWWRWNNDKDGGWGDLEFLPTVEWLKVAGLAGLLLSFPASPEDLPLRRPLRACLVDPREPDMSDGLLICPNCGWRYLDVVEEGKVPVCGMPRCRCRPLRQATAEERAALPIGATVQSPKQDLLLKDSRRFRAVQNGGVFEVYDDHFDARKPILVGADEIDGMTEGYLKSITPAREIEVAVVVDLGKFLAAVSSGRIPTVPRDDPFLVGLVRNRGAKMGMAMVTIPASWEAGDSDLHEAGWYIDRRGEVEEVCKRAPRIGANGTVYRPKPKEVFDLGEGADDGKPA